MARKTAFSLPFLFLLLRGTTCSRSTNTNTNVYNNVNVNVNANPIKTLSKALPSFPLKPTALLHSARANPRHERNINLHPHVSAVYVGLDYLDHHKHDPNGAEQSIIRHHNDNIRRFNEERKFSRFEHARIRQTNRKNSTNLDKDSRQQDPVAASGLATTAQGASFDTYQTAPLSQGIGTHYATVWVGSPVPQPQTLIVDTGSHHTAFPCKPCSNCGAEYHANPFFDPSKSESFQMLVCGQCTNDINESCHKNRQCTISQSYAERSSWKAIQVKDTFTCGYNHPSELLVTKEKDKNQLQGYDSQKLSNQYSIPFIFGCQNSLSGLFITQLADGIMGMSARENTLTKQLFNMKKIEHNMFSMCFRKNPKQDKDGVTAGVLTIGGVDTSLQRSPLVYAACNTKNEHGWYIVHVKKIWLRKGGGMSAKPVFVEGEGTPQYKLVTDQEEKVNSGSGVLVDSGATDTYLPKFIAPSFRKIWQDMTGMAYNNHGMTLTREQVLQMPTILIQMTAHQDTSDASIDADDIVGLAGTQLSKDSPRDILLAIPAIHYMEYSESDDRYTPRIYLSESTGGTLGANAMMNHDVLFDWENNRLGFAESNCDYDELVEGVEVLEEEEEDAAVTDLGDGVSKDCVLGESTLYLSCIETVNIAVCLKGGEDGDNNDHILRGITKTAILVEEEGFGDGKDCVTMVRETIIAKGMETSSKMNCDDVGICTIINQCSMTCEEAIQIVDVSAKIYDNDETDTDKEVSSENLAHRVCPDEGWSSCQHSCEQSKITSKLGPDGECHVGNVETRICHIDNCGRSDPCRVPFVVHAILLFASVDASDWTKRDEDILVESFATAVNAERESGDELFGPGDIKIKSVSKWSAVDDEFYSGNVNSGMKIVLEVAIYNDKAVLPSQTNVENNSGTKSVLDKGKDLAHVITGPERAACKESDTYPLSHTALNVHLEFEKAEFMATVIANIREFGRDFLGESVFAPLRDEGASVDQSTVLTSWTMKNEVSDFFQDGIFQGINKDTMKRHTPFVVGILLLLLGVCYCGVCVGTCCTRRKFRLEEAKNTLIRRMQKTRQDREHGEYAQVHHDSNQDGEGMGELEMGNLESFEDNPMEDVTGLDFDDNSEKISRLK